MRPQAATRDTAHPAAFATASAGAPHRRSHQVLQSQQVLARRATCSALGRGRYRHAPCVYLPLASERGTVCSACLVPSDCRRKRRQERVTRTLRFLVTASASRARCSVRSPAVSGHLDCRSLVVHCDAKPGDEAWKARPFDVQECVEEWRRKGCESHFRPSHPVRLTPHVLSNLTKTPASLTRSRVRRVASYTKGQSLRQHNELQRVWTRQENTRCARMRPQRVPLSFTAASHPFAKIVLSSELW
jgi:hypothetical protein